MHDSTKNGLKESSRQRPRSAMSRKTPGEVRARTCGTKSPSRSEALRFIDSSKSPSTKIDGSLVNFRRRLSNRHGRPRRMLIWTFEGNTDQTVSVVPRPTFLLLRMVWSSQIVPVHASGLASDDVPDDDQSLRTHACWHMHRNGFLPSLR